MNTITQEPPERMTATKASCLIRYIEIWKPSDHSDESVELESANAINDDRLVPVTPEVTRFQTGEGAIGSAVKQRGTVIFQDMPCADLERVRGATDIPITALLAFPVYFEDRLINVVALGLIDGHGAAEIWTRDDRDELSISGSFYRGLDAFEFMSQHVKFPKGAGLPGYCWKFGVPKMLDDPGGNPNFIRSFDRDPATLTSVLGLPISRTYGYPASILLLMSSLSHPLANYAAVVRVDADQPDDDTPLPAITAKCIEASSDHMSELTWQQSAIDRVGQTGRCSIIEGQAIGGGLHGGIAFPVSKKGRIDRVVVLAF
jgi:hypothetical protein